MIGLPARDVVLHYRVSQGDVGLFGEHFLAHVGQGIDADVLDGRKAVVTCPDEVFADLHLLDVNGDVKLAVEHLFHSFGKLYIVLEVQIVGLSVDFLACDEACDAFGMFGDIDGGFHLIGCVERHNQLWGGEYVSLYGHLCLGVFVAYFDAENVAEEVGDFVIVRLRDVALVELWFVLRKTL